MAKEKAAKLVGVRVRRLESAEERPSADAKWCVEVGLVHASGRWTAQRQTVAWAATELEASRRLVVGLAGGFGALDSTAADVSGLLSASEIKPAPKPVRKPRMKGSEKPITVRIWCEDDKKPSSTLHYVSPEAAATGTKEFLIQRMRYGYSVDFREWPLLHVDGGKNQPQADVDAATHFVLRAQATRWPQVEVIGCASWQFRMLRREPSN